MAQAAKYHTKLGLSTPCDYITGWLDKFKKRHGIRQLRIYGEKLSGDNEGADIFVNDFKELIEQGVTLDQIYNADETVLFWCYVQRKTLAMSNEKNPSGPKDSKERITILACSNASGAHKLKLLVIGKSANPRALSGIKTFPVIYRSNKRAWMAKEIFSEWYENHFLPEVRKNYKSLNFSTYKKIYLIIDNCSAHSIEESHNGNNEKLLFLPPNCTAVLQPMDNGILRAFKCRYKHDFLLRMVETVNAEKSILDFIKEYTIRDALWCAANAWSDISREILRNAWRNLFPEMRIMHDDGDNDNNQFGGFKVSKQKTEFMELLSYAKNRNIDLKECDVDEVMNCDDDAPTINKLTDTEIIDSVLNTNEDRDEENESNLESAEERISTESIIEALGTAIKGLEQRNLVCDEEIMSLYKIRKNLTCKQKMKQQNNVLYNF